MRTQIWILGAAFAVFAILAWVLMQQFSVAYIGLLIIAAGCFLAGWLGTK